MKIGVIYEYEPYILAIVKSVDDALTTLGHTVEVEYKHQEKIDAIGWIPPMNMVLGSSDGVVAILSRDGFASERYRGIKEEMALVTQLAPRPFVVTLIEDWADLSSVQLQAACAAVVNRMRWVAEFRGKISENEFVFNSNALHESIAKGITVEEVREVTAKAYIIDAIPVPDEQPGFLIQGFTKAGRPLQCRSSMTLRPFVKIRGVLSEPVSFFGIFPGSATSESGWEEDAEEFAVVKSKSFFELDAGFMFVKGVATAVSVENGENVYSAETTARLQQMAWGHETPSSTAELRIFEFSESHVSEARAEQ